jgi:hypothetical protein
MSHNEHIAWCKQRALEYVERGDAAGALASMMSDLNKNPETANHAGIRLTMMLMLGGHMETLDAVRQHIEGFN